MAKAKIKKDAVVLTASDQLKGYVAGTTQDNIYNMTPLQLIPEKEKNEDWKKWNLDWFERVGLKQTGEHAKKIIKNYSLANGILDKSDYVIGPENDMSDMIQAIVNDNESVLPIKFFPIIPNVINVLSGEFSKRDRRIIAKAVDEQSINEAFEYKRQMIEDILVQNAMKKKQEQMLQMGIDFENMSEEQGQQVQQEMDLAKQLAAAQVKFKTYQGIPEQWANHMIKVDDDRFDMYQLEGLAFRDMLVCDREFWHIKMLEDDYKVELWNPWEVFYHKSPSVEYVSEGNYVGRIRMMSIPDVIDNFGPQMTEDQIMNLKHQYRLLNQFPLVTDAYKDQNHWYNDSTKPYPQNYTNETWQKSLDNKVAQTLQGKKIPSNHEFDMSWYELNKSGTYLDADINGPGMVRVTEVYWKSQRKVFELTWIKKDGTIINEFVDENHKVTEPPVYDTSLSKAKSKETLVYGEHLEPIWTNQTRAGVKINTSLSSWYSRNYSDFEPIYLGGDPLPFQFKGQDNLYGSKLPVEGKVFSERGSTSSSLVDKMKPNQVSFNIVNNQILEFLADEAGNVLVLDQNTIPRNSLNGEWGKHNFPMFHQVMKDYQIAAIDPSLRNTESATNFSHFQTVDLSKTNQITSRLSLAEYFKRECFAVVGITPERVGSMSAATQTATTTNQAISSSYSQTEPYFDQHMNYLMPRVRQMMLDAAQFISATKPMSKLSYMNRDEEQVFFQMEGYRMLLSDFRVYSKSTANVKEIVQQLRQLSMQNNTAGGSLFEIAQAITLDSPAEIMSKLKEAEANRQQQIEAQREHEQQMQAQQQQFLDEQERKQMENENYWKEREIEKEIIVAQIRALGFAKDGDVNSDNVPDPLQVQEFLRQQGLDINDQLLAEREYGLKAQQQAAENGFRQQELSLKRAEIEAKERIEKLKARTALRNKVSGEK